MTQAEFAAVFTLLRVICQRWNA